MFSVIIPIYNKALFVDKAINSVFAQSFQDFELIVINDGSTDESINVINKLNALNNNSIIIINQENSGVSSARNNGVKIAKYDYITFLDADDWWEPHFLEEITKLIDEYTDAAIFASSYYKVKHSKKTLAKIGVPENFDKGYFDYCEVYSKSIWAPILTGAVVIKKSVFAEMKGFNPNLKLGEDFDLWIRVALKYKMVLTNKPLVYYNFDVEPEGRAIGKLYNPKNHVLWNLEYLTIEESRNAYLKKLIDNMRVYSLKPYFLSKQYRYVAKLELDKVDWSKQSISDYSFYKTPIFVLKVQHKFKVIVSKIKQVVLNYLS